MPGRPICALCGMCAMRRGHICGVFPSWTWFPPVPPHPRLPWPHVRNRLGWQKPSLPKQPSALCISDFVFWRLDSLSPPQLTHRRLLQSALSDLQLRHFRWILWKSLQPQGSVYRVLKENWACPLAAECTHVSASLAFLQHPRLTSVSLPSLTLPGLRWFLPCSAGFTARFLCADKTAWMAMNCVTSAV